MGGFIKRHIIIIGTICVLCLTALLIMITQNKMMAAHKQVEVIVNQHNTKADLIGKMTITVQERANSVMAMLNMADPFSQDEEFMRFNELATQFAISRIALKERLSTPEEMIIYRKQALSTSKARRTLERVVEILISGDREWATRVLLETALPAQNDVREQLTIMHQLQRKATKNELIIAEKNHQQGMLFLILLGLVVVLVSISISIFISKLLRHNINALKIANNNLESRVLERTNELIIARDEALKANRSKSTFIAVMSHELRTPLNSILGYSEILQDDCIERGYDLILPDLKKINMSGKHLIKLINEILDLSKIEAGKMKITLDNVKIQPMINDIVTTIQPFIEQHNNKLNTHHDKGIECFKSDPTRIRQILLNLLNNACKFTKNGEISLYITVLQVNKKAFIHFSVYDTGDGIADNELNHLFQEFEQGNQAHQGTGLGLVISQRFCQLMGGDICVASEKGMGSIFTVRLPMDVIS